MCMFVVIVRSRSTSLSSMSSRSKPIEKKKGCAQVFVRIHSSIFFLPTYSNKNRFSDGLWRLLFFFVTVPSSLGHRTQHQYTTLFATIDCCFSGIERKNKKLKTHRNQATKIQIHWFCRVSHIQSFRLNWNGQMCRVDRERDREWD